MGQSHGEGAPITGFSPFWTSWGWAARGWPGAQGPRGPRSLWLLLCHLHPPSSAPQPLGHSSVRVAGRRAGTGPQGWPLSPQGAFPEAPPHPRLCLFLCIRHHLQGSWEAQGLGWLALPLLLRKRGAGIWAPQLMFSSQGTRVNPQLHTPQLSGFPTSGYRAAEALEARRYSHLLLPSELPLSSQGWGWLLTPPRLHRALSGDVRGRGYSYHQVAGPGGSGGGCLSARGLGPEPEVCSGGPLRA